MPRKIISFKKLKLTIEQIHKAIRNNKSADSAANELGLRPDTFSIYLASGRYQDDNGEHPLTFDIMKNMDEEKAKLIFGNAYCQPLKIVSIPIEERPIKEIHQAIRNTKSPSAAAHSLAVRIKKLKSYLRGTFYFDRNGLEQPLTYNVLKSMKKEEAIQIWGEAYYEHLKTFKISIKEITIEQIKSKSNHAARQPLTYDVLKKMDEEKVKELEQDLGQYLEQYPLESIDVNSQLEVQSNNPSLGPSLFYSNENNPFFFNHPSTATMQNESRMERGISYPFEELAKIIKDSESLEQASNQLQTSPEILIKSLSDIGLTYEDIKQETESYKKLKDFYIKENILINIEFSSVKRVCLGG